MLFVLLKSLVVGVDVGLHVGLALLVEGEAVPDVVRVRHRVRRIVAFAVDEVVQHVPLIGALAVEEL